MHAGASREDFDLIVLGAGGAGLATALFGAIEGLKTLLIEHAAYVGGTTALSAGSLWIPGTDAGRAVNPEDNLANALAYLRACSGAAGDEAMQRRFLEMGPVAVAALERNTDVHLRAFRHHPDYLYDLEGATSCGRVLEAVPFDGRELGSSIDLIRPPIREFTLMGGMMVDRADIGHLLNAPRSLRSFRHATGLIARHIADRMRGRRSSRLVMGNALVGHLLASLLKRGVQIWRETEVLELTGDRDRVTGVVVKRAGRELALTARSGIVLAGGGFIGNARLRRQFLPDVTSYAPGAPTGSGGLIELALALGAGFGDEGNGHAFWAPVSVRTRADGSRAVFPHFVLDRAKPGTVVVDQNGRRFVNESTSYNLFGKAMIAANGIRPSIPAFLIADQRALTKYGLGMIRPGGWGAGSARRDGYLMTAPTIEGLAQMLGIDAANLARTVARLNSFARSGIDEDFRRGTTVYERNLGDPAIGPNPTLRPIEHAPFHAIKLYPGEIGTSTGLLTDEDARVLAQGKPIAGLFAVGNDMHSIMGGAYPGPGITLGPAIVLAYVAACAAAADVRASNQ